MTLSFVLYETVWRLTYFFFLYIDVFTTLIPFRFVKIYEILAEEDSYFF